jgi:hypothetical protein
MIADPISIPACKKGSTSWDNPIPTEADAAPVDAGVREVMAAAVEEEGVVAAGDAAGSF